MDIDLAIWIVERFAGAEVALAAAARIEHERRGSFAASCCLDRDSGN